MPRKDDRDLTTLINANAQADYKKMRKLLMNIVEGKLLEKVVCRERGANGATWVEEVPPSHKDRIAAAKVLKELQVDKSIANKKDATESNIPADMVAAIAEIHAKKEKEIQDKLEKEGKLRRIDS